MVRNSATTSIDWLKTDETAIFIKAVSLKNVIMMESRGMCGIKT